MDITTRFNVGDMCHLLHENEVIVRKILAIRIDIADDDAYITYKMRDNEGEPIWKPEYKLFDGKQELLDSL